MADCFVIEGRGCYDSFYVKGVRGLIIVLLSVCICNMTTIKNSHFARLEMEARLSDAISNWRSDRPRRWLAKYGNVIAEGRSPLAVQFSSLRCEAESLLRRPRTKRINGLASHLLHL